MVPRKGGSRLRSQAKCLRKPMAPCHFRPRFQVRMFPSALCELQLPQQDEARAMARVSCGQRSETCRLAPALKASCPPPPVRFASISVFVLHCMALHPCIPDPAFGWWNLRFLMLAIHLVLVLTGLQEWQVLSTADCPPCAYSSQLATSCLLAY